MKEKAEGNWMLLNGPESGELLLVKRDGKTVQTVGLPQDRLGALLKHMQAASDCGLAGDSFFEAMQEWLGPVR
jgi:hypothetical protein